MPGGTTLFSHGITTSRGVCVLINPSLTFNSIKQELIPFGIFIIGI